MMEDNKYEIEDLITSAFQQKPVEFETAFNDIIIDRIRSAVEEKKVAIAQQMYNYELPDDYDDNDDDELDYEEDSSEE